MSVYILPLLFIGLFVYCLIKKINTYETFIQGAKGSIKLVISIFPYIATIMIAVSLLRVSGITNYISTFLSPMFGFFGIPKELCELVILRPFTGSGSIALLNDIIINYGPDSYISRCACVILGCSETIFYVTTIYLSQTKIKKLLYAIPVALTATFIGTIIACLVCRIM
jgi:spore maturation protein B